MYQGFGPEPAPLFGAHEPSADEKGRQLATLDDLFILPALFRRRLAT